MKMSSSGTSMESVAVELSLLAAFDDLTRCNNVLNDGVAEECFLRFAKQQEWCRQQWEASVAEGQRLKRELDAALSSVSALEQKFIHARKLLDAEKRHRRIAEEDRLSLEKQMAMARDLLFNDNRNKLNDETLEKLQFLNSTGKSHHVDHHNANLYSGNLRLNAIPEMNSTGALLSDQSVSRSEDDLDVSMAAGRRSWRRARAAAADRSGAGERDAEREGAPQKKRRSSGGRTLSSSWSNGEAGVVLATATTTLTLQHGEQTATAATPTQRREAGRSSPRSSARATVASAPEASSPSAPPPQPDSGSDYCSDSGAAHNWINKTVIKPEPCVACGKRITFAKAAFRCQACRSAVHTGCRALAAPRCLPPTPGAPGTPGRGTPGGRLRLAACVPVAAPRVPPLVVHCADQLETRGLGELGLYRIPGSEREVRLLKQLLLNGDIAPVRKADVHSVCSCLKYFLRELDEPLVTKASRTAFISAATTGNETTLRRVFSQLPDPNRHTLAFLLLHLRRVGSSAACKMPPKNLAMVFAPTLIGYESGSADICSEDVYEQSRAQVTLMEALLNLPVEWLSGQMGQQPQRRHSPSQTTSEDRSSPEREHAPPRGFFYSPISSSNSVSRKQRKFYAP